jgi:hypothetical protein
MNNEEERKLSNQAERIYFYIVTCLGATIRSVVTVRNLNQLDKCLCGISKYIYIYIYYIYIIYTVYIILNQGLAQASVT